MRTTFSPLISSHLGFDALFDELETMLHIASARPQSQSYPPLNLLKEENGDYVIEMALAGFRKEDIEIKHDRKRGSLTITGDTSARKSNVDTTEGTSKSREVMTMDGSPRSVVLKQGIASRSFSRSFTLADDLEVSEAELVDGMLTIKLKKFELPEHQPILIPLK